MGLAGKLHLTQCQAYRGCSINGHWSMRGTEFQSIWAIWYSFHAKMGRTDSHPSEGRPGLRENFVQNVPLRREQAKWAGLNNSVWLTR